MSEAEGTGSAIGPEELRLLKWHELVKRGDFVKDRQTGFVPWEGPSGFRADAFVKKIYRRLKQPQVETLKP